eukprot:CAMPEP_0114369030 /NCGR_PEP_ID=MMETSP0101-20121206/31328_1 /TAXON_ID=38822 ORGANISM="Pteridomonas danica, Strain PT" /NCGR_SAMPLE_ID=MMETSP0101 /ASSEMBLY_ACC=CAM_ASM_000211 /LENGTH=101 /DNA_ID=CAMNT_0001519603 /DNA_START=120 /DNA_END=421 /DNA_ORIENTATION=+
MAAYSLVLFQMRFIRFFTKIFISYAALSRDNPMVEFLSSFLPTSHQAMLDSEARVEISPIDVSSQHNNNDDDEGVGSFERTLSFLKQSIVNKMKFSDDQEG